MQLASARRALGVLVAVSALTVFPSVAYATVGVNKSFTPNSVVAGQSSTLTVVLLNPNSSSATGVALTDTLPNGVTVANPLNVATNTCGFSTASIVPGTRPIPLSGGTIPALSGANPGQCSITIDVVSATPNTYLNTIAAGSVASSQGSNSQDAQATLVVSSPLNVTGSKAFAPTNVHGNGPASRLTITLTNPNAIALTNAAITDSLPANVTVASGAGEPNPATTCGGGTATASAPATNPATIALSGGTIPANASCTLAVDVVARNPNALVNGNQTNTIAANALTTAQGVTSPAISANINVQTGASLTKAFAPTPIASNDASTLTITVTNFNSTDLSPLSTPPSPITFTDNFPAAITATGGASTNTCGGTLTPLPAGGPPFTSFTITGGTLAGVVGAAPGSTTCQIVFPVKASATATNTIPATSFGTVVIAAASGTLSVSAITGSKAFTTPAIQTGSTTMTATLNNLTGSAATITAFTDLLTTMGAGFTVGGAVTNTCGLTLNAAVGATSITAVAPFTGSIPAGGSCTVTVPIAISATAATGNRTNTIAANGIHTSVGNNTVAITGVVNVQRALTMSKAFNLATIQGGAVSRLTVTLAPTVNLTGVGFTDDLTTMGAGFALSATPNAVATNCGAGTLTANAGATSFALSGGTLTAGTNCTVAVSIATPASTGVFTNTIPAANFVTTQGVTTANTTANLTLINASVTVNKSFSPTTVAVGNTTAGNPNFSTLSIQIRNNNAGAVALTGVALTDALPQVGAQGMVVGNPATASFTGAGCSGATITAPVGATSISMSGANVGANSICTLSVRVVGTISGNLINTVSAGAIGSNQGVSNPLQGTATLAVTGTVNLTVIKTDGTTTAVPGTNTTYTVKVSNAGPNAVTGLVVNDPLPTGMTFTSWTCVATAGSTCPASGSGPIAATVTILNGGSVTFTITAAITSSATGSISNTVSLAVPGSVIDTNPVTSATDTDTLTPQADLAITKTDSGLGTAVPGSSITYTIVASNNGPSDAPGAMVADTFPLGITSASWTCVGSAGSACPASGSGSINALVNLIAGGTVTFTVNATISSTALGTLSNTATVAAPAGVTDPNPANNSATDNANLTPQADLAITKTDGVSSINAGGSTTYTIVASNNGPSAVTGATVADNAPLNLSFASWTCVATGGSSCPASGSGNISASVNLLVGGTATFTVPATVAGGATGSISNTATISVPAGVVDLVPGNNSATDTDTITPVADLSITKTDGVATVVPGGQTTYTITVHNNGPSGVVGATVGDLMPVAITSDTFTATQSGGASGFTASGGGNIADTVSMSSGSTITYTVVANISASATGSLSNTATVAVPSGVVDPTPGNNSSTDTDSLTPHADLSITKTDGTTSATPGASTTYTIVVSNAGPSSVTGATVTDTLPAEIASDSFTAVAAGGATGFTASGSGNISDTVTMPSGSSITYTVVANIDASATGTLVNTATVAVPPGVTDPNPANNSATDSDTLAPQVALVVSKSDGSTSYTPGGMATYTVTVTNNGPSAATNVTLIDSFPAGLTLSADASCVANGNADCGTVTGTLGQTGFGTTGAQLGTGPGDSLVFSAPVAFASSMTAPTVANTATATDLVTNNTASDTDTDTLAPDVSLSAFKTDGSTTYTPGGAATYTITITDTGVSDATNVTVTDPLPAGVTLSGNASCVANGSASCGTVTGATGQMSFGTTGANVPVGAGNSIVLSGPVAFSAAMTTDPLDNKADATDLLSGATGSSTDSDALALGVSLAVNKTDGSPTYAPGGAATYTITVTDTGLSDAIDVTVTDALPGGVTLSGTVTCTPNGTASCGTVTGTTGQSTLGTTGAQIPAGAGNSLVFTTPVAFATNMLADPLINSASASDGASGASGSGSDSDGRAATADISITKADGVTTAVPGQSVTYTIVVANSGPSDVTGATVADTLPAAIASATWTCVASGGGTCTASGSGNIGDTVDLPVGATLTYTLDASIAPDAIGTLTNTATVSPPGNVTDPNPGNNSATDSDTLTPMGDLSITKTDGVSSVNPGQAIVYTIVATNSGPSAVAGATVTDALPATIIGGVWTCAASAGSSCPASGSGNISATVNLLVGGTATFTLNATVSGTASGSISNTATIAAPAGVTDTDPSNNSATDTDTVIIILLPDLTIAKVHNGNGFAAGQMGASYTITVRNVGSASTSGTVTVVDTLPAGLTATAMTGTGWTCTVGTLTCTRGDALPPAMSYPAITLTVNVASTASGTLVNNVAVSGGGDSSGGNNNASDSVTIVPARLTPVPVPALDALLVLLLALLVAAGAGLRRHPYR